MAKLLDAAACPFDRKVRTLVPFVGWFRGIGGWRKVVEAQTERDCWKLLMDYKDPHRLECERCVLRAGARPPR